MRPMSLELAGQTYRVEWIGPDESLGKNAANPHGDFGSTSQVRQRIRIREGQGFESERDTVLHEALHAILLLTSNTDRFVDANDEEAVVNALAVGMLAALRRNPGLAGYLTALELA